MIRNYLENKFDDFIKILSIDSTPNPSLYSWMNFQVVKVYFKRSDSINKEYAYEINFTSDASALVQFVLGR